MREKKAAEEAEKARLAKIEEERKKKIDEEKAAKKKKEDDRRKKEEEELFKAVEREVKQVEAAKVAQASLMKSLDRWAP